MKFKIFLIFCMLCAGAISGRAQSGDTGDLHWELADSVLTISGTGAIPSSSLMLGDVPWKDYRNNIIAVDIQNGVTSIGNRAFYNYSNLTSITIPNSVTSSIGYQAFASCNNLQNITVKWPTPLSIRADIFEGVDKNTCILHVPAGTKLLYQATDVWKDFVLIVEEGESPCDNPIASGTTGELTWILCGGTLTISGDEAMPDYGRDNAPWKDYLNNFFAIDIQNGVTSIGNGAFYNSRNLTSITIPNSVTSIGNYAFYNSRNLTSITIPNSVTSIGDWAFLNCSSLTSITIPGSVTSIGERAFANCYNLTSIAVDRGNQSYASEAGVLFDKTKTTLIQYPIQYPAKKIDDIYVIPESVTSIRNGAFYNSSNLTSITIPNSVTSIGIETFSDCSSLASITIPNSVTSIGNKAFYCCSSLASITISNSVTSIGERAFANCYNLTSIAVDSENQNYASEDGILFNKTKTALIQYPTGKQGTYTIPNSVTSIGNDAFDACHSLTSVTIPKSVTSIGERAFTYCSVLQDVTVHWDNPLVIDPSVFGYVTLANCILHVPAGTKSLYQAADVWKDFGTIIEQAPITVTSINLDQTSLELLVDSTAQLTATVLPENAANKNVTWSSSNENIATVSTTGLVTAKVTGYALIFVTTEDGNKTDSCLVTVTRPLRSDATLSSLTVDKGTLTPAFDSSITSYAVSVENAVTSMIITVIANDTTATVSGTGAKTLSVGENPFDIVVTAEDGTQKTYTVTVTRLMPDAIAVTSVSLDKNAVSLLVDATEQLTATVLPENATNKNVTWNSNNESVATVSATGLVTAKIPGTATIAVTTEDGYKTDSCVVTVTRLLSNDATLSSLVVNQGTLTPAFDSSVTSYTVSVENAVTSIILSAIANDTTATVSGAGTKTLSVGENVFEIVVTAEDGTEMIYTVTVTRALSGDATLSGLTVNQGTLTPAFDSSVTSYTVSVENAVTSIVILAIANDTTATVSGDGTKTLSVGENVFDIIVTAEDGTEMIYTVAVTRALSSDATLSSLTVNTGTLTPAFDSNVTSYTVSVENAVTNISITATANDATASVSGDGTQTLNVGDNMFDIIVTAEDGTQQTYTVTVTRLEPEVIAVTSISLDKTSLELSVDSAAQLTATVLPENAANKNVTWSSSNEAVATVSSSGLVTAKAAGTATITVTTEDGNLTAECLVSVQKPEETIVVEETKPAGADGNGTIELSLNIPSDASFVGFFYMEFPSGLVLNQMLTTLVMELVPYYDLTISQVSEGKWLFVIRQKTLRGKQDLTYSKIMDIVYHVEEGTEDGAYNLEISDLKFDFDDGTSIEIPELSVPVTVDQTYTGIRNASSEKPTASVKDNVLRVKSPVSERISVYSTNGILLYMNDKQAGEALFNIGSLSDKILIVKGNSGWVRKVKMVNK